MKSGAPPQQSGSARMLGHAEEQHIGVASRWWNAPLRLGPIGLMQ